MTKISLNHSILEACRIAYAITDGNLRVIEVSDTIDLFCEQTNGWVGHPLLELVPELIGNEVVLAEILQGNLEDFQLSYINRNTAGDEMTYLSLIELPYRDECGQITGLLHLMQDVTQLGVLNQYLSQQLNKLRWPKH
ncbi:MAG: PAS domain-containing protein [Anaerolineae bacterium]|nr:PAS domain-containing protein [Anaerolineae bacterium]